jgi:hypothetical protein
MIEKLKLEKLDFRQIDIKKEVPKISLRKTAQEIFPLFEKGYLLSLKYESRAAFGEDENFINMKVEMEGKLVSFRESSMYYGLSDNDKKYIKELNSEWIEYEKDFPIFKGEPRRLFTFWLLSYLDFIEGTSFLKYKMNLMVDLFFFEKILDYIIFKGDKEIVGNDEILTIIKRFSAPLDHYGALNLILRNIKITNKILRNRLFEFYNGLYDSLKNKILPSNLILNKIHNLLIQDEYDKGYNTIEQNKGLLFREKPVEAIRLMWKLYYKFGRDKLYVYFENLKVLKELFSLVPSNKIYRMASVMLSEFNLSNMEIIEFLEYNLNAFEKEAFFRKDYSFILKRYDGYFKRTKFERVEEFIERYSETFLRELPFEFISFYINYLRKKDKKELTRVFNNKAYVLNLLGKIKNSYLRAKVVILILSEIEIEDETLKKDLFCVDGLKVENTEVLKLKIRAFIKQKKDYLLKDYIYKFKIKAETFSPFEFLTIVFLLSQELDFEREFFDERIISILIKGLKRVPDSDIVKYLFVWGIINFTGLMVKYIKEFSDVLEENIHSNLYLKNELSFLKEYLKKRDKILTSEPLHIKEFNEFFPYEFADDLFKNDLEKRIVTINKLKKNISLNKIISMPFLKHKVVDYIVEKNVGFFIDRGEIGPPWEGSLYRYNLITDDKNILQEKIHMQNGMLSIINKSRINDLLFTCEENNILCIKSIKPNKKTENSRLFCLKHIKYPGELFVYGDNIYLLDFLGNNIIEVKNGSVKKYSKKGFKEPFEISVYENEIIVGFRKCDEFESSCIVKLRDFSPILPSGNDNADLILKKAPVFSFSSDKDTLFFSIMNIIFEFKKGKIISKTAIKTLNPFNITLKLFITGNSLYALSSLYNEKKLYIYNICRKE